jgi:hypothetical protein
MCRSIKNLASFTGMLIENLTHCNKMAALSPKNENTGKLCLSRTKDYQGEHAWWQ